MSLNNKALLQRKKPRLRMVSLSLVCLYSGLGTSPMNALEVVEDKSEISDIPALDEEFLAFLAQAESVDETFLDPLDMLEMDELDEDESLISKSKVGDELENKKIKSEKELESDLKSHDSKMNSQINRMREEER